MTVTNDCTNDLYQYNLRITKLRMDSSTSSKFQRMYNGKHVGYLFIVTLFLNIACITSINLTVN